MEARAILKYARISPRKVKIVMDLIRNQDADKAMAILKFTPKSACEYLEKLLASAIANAENNHNNSALIEEILEKAKQVAIEISKLIESKEFKAQDRNGQYHLWTKREATVKALNLKLLGNDLPKFKGVNNSVLTADGEFSVSIYNDSELNLKEISYEDYI